jgi:hypothetical protein
MKYLALLGALAAIYIIFSKQASPIASVKEAVAQTEITETAPAASGKPAATPAPSPGTGLRAPITRTRAALDAVRKRNGTGEF